MKKRILIVLSILVVVLITFFYFLGNSSGNQPKVIDDNKSPTKIVNIDAGRFVFTPDTITVKKGEHVKFVINNRDTTHGIIIPDLKVSGIDSVEFTASESGTYAFHCPTVCGKGHREMKGLLIVED